MSEEILSNKRLQFFTTLQETKEKDVPFCDLDTDRLCSVCLSVGVVNFLKIFKNSKTGFVNVICPDPDFAVAIFVSYQLLNNIYLILTLLNSLKACPKEYHCASSDQSSCCF